MCEKSKLAYNIGNVVVAETRKRCYHLLVINRIYITY